MNRQHMIWLTGLALLYFSVELMGTIIPGLGMAKVPAVRPNSEILVFAALPALASVGFFIAGVSLVGRGLMRRPEQS